VDGVVRGDADHGGVHEVSGRAVYRPRLFERIDDAPERREPRVDVPALDTCDQRLGDIGALGEFTLREFQFGPSLP